LKWERVSSRVDGRVIFERRYSGNDQERDCKPMKSLIFRCERCGLHYRKRYSSGTTVRLLCRSGIFEPEILIIDEVLAVGDAEFQKKKLWGKCRISKQGVERCSFVSHNMVRKELYLKLCLSTCGFEGGD
jgi:ABC-type molybdenum transport system ATPase subunit/photorepair protein PhrA